MNFKNQEKDFNDKYEKIADINEGIILLLEKKTQAMSFVVKLTENDLIWIYISLDGRLARDEFNCNDFLGHLISYYLHKLKNEFMDFFKEIGVDAGRIKISIFPDSYVKRMSLDDKLVENLNKTHPLNIITNYIEDSDIWEISIFYSDNSVESIFESECNHGERFVIKELIKSIYLNQDDNLVKAENIAEKFIDQNIAVDVKGFVIEKLAVLNECLKDYIEPFEISDTSRSMVKSLITEFFNKSSIIEPGTYSNDELKEIDNEIYKFLQSKLESEIKKYNLCVLIHFTYLQIEYLRHYRESMEIGFGMAEDTRIEYNMVNEKSKITGSFLSRFNPLQHLIESILKVNPSGEKDLIITEEWQYLQALAACIVEIATISDLIHYKLTNFEMIILNDYSFTQIEKEDKIDEHEYLLNKSRLELKYDRVKYERAKKPQEKDVNKKAPKEYDGVDEAFLNEFEFGYWDFITVLIAMSQIQPNQEFYPLVFLEKKSLIHEIKHQIIKKTPSDLIIEKILDFIAYSNNKGDILLPNVLQRSKDRFSLKPLIKFSDNDEILYSYGIMSVHSTGGIYSHQISKGRFPYVLINNNSLKTELKLLEKNCNNILEDEVKTIAISLFGPDKVESKLKNFKRIDHSLERNPYCGEIDCLVIDENKKIIHVLEAKDVKVALNPKEQRQEIDKFLNPKDKNYAGKLMKKVDFVHDNLAIFLNHFQIPDKDNWDIKYAFITYEFHLTAFSSDNEIKFIPLDELDEYLKGE